MLCTSVRAVPAESQHSATTQSLNNHGTRTWNRYHGIVPNIGLAHHLLVFFSLQRHPRRLCCRKLSQILIQFCIILSAHIRVKDEVMAISLLRKLGQGVLRRDSQEIMFLQILKPHLF